MEPRRLRGDPDRADRIPVDRAARRRRLAAALPLPIVAGLLLVACDAPAPPTGGPGTVERSRRLMGTTFSIQVVHASADRAEEAIEAALQEVSRVEELLSEWKASSEISEVNRSAGAPVAVGPELFEVVERAVRVSERTAGAFDVSFASCGSVWRFDEPRIPTDAEIERCLALVDFRAIELDPVRSTVRLGRPGMRIGIAGIGKGYGVDRAASILERHGIHDYVVDGGGDLRVAGRKPDGPWTVGITDPRAPDRLLGAIAVDGGAVVTSGDYRIYFERDGVRYHHILDPATGRPASGSAGVTVLAPAATEADALATGLFVLGPERALSLVETLPGVELLLVDPQRTVHRSSGFPQLLDPAVAAR